MTSTDKWDRIVGLYNQHLGAKEEVVQGLWENIFADFFGYIRVNGEIERKRSMQIGSKKRAAEADIIIKNGNCDLFVVELKQHNVPRSKDMESQLMSYLKLLRLNIGLLICDKIYIYCYDSGKPDDEQSYAVIDFIGGDRFGFHSYDGELFIEMFCKGRFGKEGVADFIHHQQAFMEKVAKIKEEITAELAAQLLGNHFAKKYGHEAFKVAWEGFAVNIAQKSNAAGQPIAPQIAASSRKGSKPARSFQINGTACDEKAFEQALQKSDSCVVDVAIIYSDGRRDERRWNVNNFGPDSNLSGNLSSGFLRGWREKGIVAIELKM